MLFEQVDCMLFLTPKMNFSLFLIPNMNFSYHAPWAGWSYAVQQTGNEHFWNIKKHTCRQMQWSQSSGYLYTTTTTNISFFLLLLFILYFKFMDITCILQCFHYCCTATYSHSNVEQFIRCVPCEVVSEKVLLETEIPGGEEENRSLTL